MNLPIIWIPFTIEISAMKQSCWLTSSREAKAKAKAEPAEPKAKAKAEPKAKAEAWLLWDWKYGEIWDNWLVVTGCHEFYFPRNIGNLIIPTD